MDNDKLLAEVKALRAQVRMLTIITTVCLMGVGILAIWTFGFDGILALLAYAILAIIILATVIVGFMKVCQFRDQQKRE